MDKRTLHIYKTTDLRLGGIPRAMQNILEVEYLLGYKSEILSTFSDDSEVRMKTYLPDSSIHLFKKSFPGKFFRSTDAIKWLKVNAKNYDLIVLHGIWNFFLLECSMVVCKLKANYIFWPHASLHPLDMHKKHRIKEFLGKVLIKPFISSARFICCTSKAEENSLITFGASVNAYVLPLPVPNRFGIKGDAKAFREKYNISADDFVLLSFGRLDPKKGIDITIQALPALIKKHANIKFVVAGPDNGKDYLTILKQQAAALHLDKYVIFTGMLSGGEINNAFSGSNIFVLPSLYENFGISVIEAMQNGLPVMISSNVDIWEDIVNKRGGWVCEYSVSSVENTISQIIEDKESLANFTANAARIAEAYSPECLKKSFEIFYEKVFIKG